jgi:hypothetical protein
MNPLHLFCIYHQKRCNKLDTDGPDLIPRALKTIHSGKGV